MGSGGEAVWGSAVGGVLATEMDKEQGQRGQSGHGLIQLIFGCVMVGVGVSYRDQCQNGAAEYLYYAGIITIVCNLVGSLLVCFKTYAEKDGNISCVESCGICLLSITNCCLLISSIVLLFWGSVVVFGAYSAWKYDGDDVLDPQYCHYTPFMTAFVILILNWIMLPFLIVCSCLAVVCAYCCAKK